MCETSSERTTFVILGIFDYFRMSPFLLTLTGSRRDGANDQGIMISYWIGLAFYYTSGQIAWRFPVTFQCVFTFAM